MPASRPELDLEVRMELLDRFLRDYDRDRREGKTVPALHNTLEKHIDEDDRRFERLIDRELARAQRSEEKAIQYVPLPTPRSSWPSKMIKKVFEKPAAILLVALATVLAHLIIKTFVR
jgi:phytoene/squalene synthetase